MDSERRHELQDNALEQSLRKAPALLRDYGTYLVLAVIAVAAGWYWYNARSSEAVAKQDATSQALLNLSRTLGSAEQMGEFAAFMPPDELARRQSELTSEFDQYALVVTDNGQPAARAHLLRLQGDLAWAMATLPAASGNSASTQPSTQPAPATRPAADWLADARASYRKVVEQYPKQTADNLAALFGLAAVAEQDGKFDEAATFYDQLIARDDLGEATKSIAVQRKTLLSLLGVAPRLVAAEVPPASTQPAEIGDLMRMLPDGVDPAAGPATSPSLLPATTPAAAEVGEDAFLPPTATTSPATQP